MSHQADAEKAKKRMAHPFFKKIPAIEDDWAEFEHLYNQKYNQHFIGNRLTPAQPRMDQTQSGENTFVNSLQCTRHSTPRIKKPEGARPNNELLPPYPALERRADDQEEINDMQNIIDSENRRVETSATSVAPNMGLSATTNPKALQLLPSVAPRVGHDPATRPKVPQGLPQFQLSDRDREMDRSEQGERTRDVGLQLAQDSENNRELLQENINKGFENLENQHKFPDFSRAQSYRTSEADLVGQKLLSQGLNRIDLSNMDNNIAPMSEQLTRQRQLQNLAIENDINNRLMPQRTTSIAQQDPRHDPRNIYGLNERSRTGWAAPLNNNLAVAPNVGLNPTTNTVAGTGGNDPNNPHDSDDEGNGPAP